ncbi:MAG: 6-bladed beta-propeller [Planctomycetes bacterium]|nr:6-bladed beta-propeller [Planctomycetota bacterium]
MLASRNHIHLKLPGTTGQFVLSLTLVIMLCCGCGSSRGNLFGELDEPVVWPEPPEQARIQYLGELSTEDDLKREVSGMAAFGRFIFGREDIGVLVSPRSVALDDEERLFIADTSGGVMHMMDLEGRKYGQFSKLEGDETLLSPVGVVVVGQDIYVTDSALGKVCVFSTEGKYKFSFGSDTLQRPSGIAYNGVQGTIYVADAKRHSIDIFDVHGRHVLTMGGHGTGNGMFNFPTYIWIDKKGRLYVSDTLNYRVQIFGADGKFLRSIGKHGNRPGYFAHPCGIATDSHGNIYVSDKQFENIQIFNSAGQILMAVGGEGHGPGEFWLPAGIFIDDSDRIFIADSFNRRVQVLQLLEAEKP